MSAPLPIAVSPAAGSPLACGAVLFRHRGLLRVTVIAKATFALVHEGTATLAPPAALLVEDTQVDRSLRAASDLAPHRPHVDVTFVGHACALGREAPATVARLAIFRERALIDKTLHVYGDRARPGDGIVPTPGAVRPFDRMPLTYERAHALLDEASDVENPVGVAEPNLVDPRHPQRPACFGPISPSWPSRARLLATVDRDAFEAPVAEIPDAFDWRYFQVAPPDQQLEVLRGDEWIVLDGLHPTLPRVQTRLPSAVAAARVHVGSASRPGGEPLALVADTLAIDGDRQSCEVVWRGSFPVAGGEAALAKLRVVVGLELPGQPVAWPESASGSPRVERAAGAEPVEEIDTADVVPDDAGKRMPTDARAPATVPATPFVSKGAAPPEAAASAAPPVRVARKPSRSMATVAVAYDFTALPVMPFAPSEVTPPLFSTAAEEGTEAGSQAVVVAAPFPLAQPGAARGPAPEIPGAPWAAPAARAPEIVDAMAGTLVEESPVELRSMMQKEADASPPPRPPEKPAPPAASPWKVEAPPVESAPPPVAPRPRPAPAVKAGLYEEFRARKKR